MASVKVTHTPWKLTPLADIVARGREPADWLVKDWLYRSRHHSIYGQPSSGKTFIAIKLCVDLIKRGGHVLYLDEENGENELGERLRDFGCRAALVKEAFHYRWAPDLSSRRLGGFEATLDKLRPDLVVYDSAGHFYATAVMDENSNIDAIRWHKKYVMEPLSKIGAASLIIDHDTRKPSVDGARGAGAKQQLTEVGFKTETVTRFNRRNVGTVNVQVTKDRPAWLSDGRTIRLGGTPFEYTVSASEVTVTKVSPKYEKVLGLIDETWRPLAYYMHHAELTREPCRRHLTKAVEEGEALSRQDDGPRGAWKWRSNT